MYLNVFQPHIVTVSAIFKVNVTAGRSGHASDDSVTIQTILLLGHHLAANRQWILFIGCLLHTQNNSFYACQLF
jgi:hypothetical protein